MNWSEGIVRRTPSLRWNPSPSNHTCLFHAECKSHERSHPLPHQFVQVGKESFPLCSHRLSPMLCAPSFLPVWGLIAGGWEGALPKTPSSALLSWALPTLLPTKSSWPSSTYNEKDYQSSTGFSSWPCIWTWTIPPAPHPESRRALL